MQCYYVCIINDILVGQRFLDPYQQYDDYVDVSTQNTEIPKDDADSEASESISFSTSYW